MLTVDCRQAIFKGSRRLEGLEKKDCHFLISTKSRKAEGLTYLHYKLGFSTNDIHEAGSAAVAQVNRADLDIMNS